MIIQWATQAPPPHLLGTAPLIVVTTDKSSVTSLSSQLGHSADMREYLRSALEVSWAVFVTLDGMKQPPRLFAVIDLVPTMVCCCFFLACYMHTKIMFIDLHDELDHYMIMHDHRALYVTYKLECYRLISYDCTEIEIPHMQSLRDRDNTVLSLPPHSC